MVLGLSNPLGVQIFFLRGGGGGMRQTVRGRRALKTLSSAESKKKPLRNKNCSDFLKLKSHKNTFI
jgi:hypothetical protein